jgi:hypothetical protein
LSIIQLFQRCGCNELVIEAKMWRGTPDSRIDAISRALCFLAAIVYRKLAVLSGNLREFTF